MNRELFFDESGDFERNKHCLVGGFVSNSGEFNFGVANIILYEIRNSDTVKKLIEKYNAATGKKWVFSHCSNNLSIPERWEIQAVVLKMLKEQIVRRNGKLIIFDNPSGTYNEDNTTNFLSVLSKGLLAYFLDTDSADRLYVNVAERKNITYSDENADLSPTSARISKLSDGRTIMKPQYVSQMNNLANLYGGQTLLKTPKYKEMIANIKIIHDKVGNNGTESNPLTTICDYICNTYYAKENRSRTVTRILDDVFGSSIRIYNINSPLKSAPVLSYSDRSTENLGSAFMLLAKHNFPEPETSTFYDMFNSCDYQHQRQTVSTIIDNLYPVVYAQVDMPEILMDLEKMLDSTKAISNGDTRNELHANLLLFAETLYMHMGDQGKVAVFAEKVNQTIEMISDDNVKNDLLNKFENRLLVDLNDHFAYDEAERLFKEMNDSWESVIAGYRRRNPNAKYPEYGKAVGSYLQMLRHRIHSSENADDKELYYLDAQKLYDQGQNNFTKSEDISRFYQTRCDIESEMQCFDKALESLYCAALISNGRQMKDETADPRTMTCEIREASGAAGKKNPYMYQHLVRLLAEMYSTDPTDPVAEEMLKEILPEIGETTGENIRNTHPRTQIQWKIASVLAWRKASSSEQRVLANRLMDKAADTLLQNEFSGIFAAIAVGILAERAYHIKAGNIPGNLNHVLKKLAAAYEQFTQRKDTNSKDPFAPLMILESGNPEQLLEISKIIGY